MNIFSNDHITFATIKDITVIKDLLDNAYRGEFSKQGWTTEAHLIDGNVRTSVINLHEVMKQPGSVFLKYVSEQDEVLGCVNLQKHERRIYLGMFAVSPHFQGGGIGKQILKAAEKYARHVQCNSIFMTVISVRTELINWYQRHGYKDTGERKAFIEDEETGKHLEPLQFMILEKIIY